MAIYRPDLSSALSEDQQLITVFQHRLRRICSGIVEAVMFISEDVAARHADRIIFDEAEARQKNGARIEDFILEMSNWLLMGMPDDYNTELRAEVYAPTLMEDRLRGDPSIAPVFCARLMLAPALDSRQPDMVISIGAVGDFGRAARSTGAPLSGSIGGALSVWISETEAPVVEVTFTAANPTIRASLLAGAVNAFDDRLEGAIVAAMVADHPKPLPEIAAEPNMLIADALFSRFRSYVENVSDDNREELQSKNNRWLLACSILNLRQDRKRGAGYKKES